MTTLPHVIHQLATDPAFRAKVAAADPQALGGLTQEEREALLTLRHLLALPPQEFLARIRTSADAPLGWILSAEDLACS